MIQVDQNATIGGAFRAAAHRYGDRPLIMMPANPDRAYCREGCSISYRKALAEVDRLIECYRQAGYGVGHRVALDLENRPEHLLHKLALNALGICCIPLNFEYRANELQYIVDHSRPDLIIAAENRLPFVEAVASGHVEVCLETAVRSGLPRAVRQADPVLIDGTTAASILYTSGTTGRPKGCVLSHGYELECGAWYLALGGLATFNEGADRLYNPLPLYHVNASVFSFFCVMLAGNCQIIGDRFHPQRWWNEIRACEATVVHYLGVIVPLLLGQPASDQDRAHQVRFGIGAGVEATLHQKFEERFGFPLIEVWGMTEMVGVFADNFPPRSVGTRAFGKAPAYGLEARIVDADDQPVPDGEVGELTIRHSAETPRRRFFSGYLGDPEATERAWRGGWFHTGDLVRRSPDGTMHFVDRDKNIIRRSGENIAAAEVEEMLQDHPLVKQATVIAVDDEVREEEVYACVVLKSGAGDVDTARSLFLHCMQHLSYYKAPAYIWFTDRIPVSGTQKIQKYLIFKDDVDPRKIDGVFDFRKLKRRNLDFN